MKEEQRTPAFEIKGNFCLFVCLSALIYIGPEGGGGGGQRHRKTETDRETYRETKIQTERQTQTDDGQDDDDDSNINFVLFFVCLRFVSDTANDSVMWYYVFTDDYSD